MGGRSAPCCNRQLIDLRATQNGGVKPPVHKLTFYQDNFAFRFQGRFWYLVGYSTLVGGEGTAATALADVADEVTGSGS
jgi:hypothetical protein